MDEDERYPGSARRRGQRPEPPPETEDRWDSRPRIYRMGGRDQEFFLVGDLAKALGRSPVTIRKWERLGLIPRATFRSPAVSGKSVRLYTREMIEGVVEIAREEGVLENRKSQTPDIRSTHFTERCNALFQRLRPRTGA